MSREDLHAMFTEMAEDVDQPRLVGPALAKAAKVRRRHAVVGAFAAAAVVATTGAILMRPGHPAPTPPLSTRIGSTEVVHLPATIQPSPRSIPYWPEALNPGSDAPSLDDAPISHASLLYSPAGEGIGDQAPPIYVYGEGSVNGGSGDGSFHWARLDVDLTLTRDVDGNKALPLDLNSLGPMGMRAAFAQPDAVVIVNLVDGGQDWIELPGLNEEVTWLINGRHLLVSGAGHTWLVDTESRTAVLVAANGFEVVPVVGEASSLTTLSQAASPGEPHLLRIYDATGLVEQSRHAVEPHADLPYRLEYLSPRGWRYGALLAQAGSGRRGSEPADFVAVINVSGRYTHILDMGDESPKVCCAVVGWGNQDSVLIYVASEGLLNWDIQSGAVHRLTAPASGLISVASNGCDWTLTIGGETSSCVT